MMTMFHGKKIYFKMWKFVITLVSLKMCDGNDDNEKWHWYDREKQANKQGMPKSRFLDKV